jgi:hypothetical protein
MEVFQVMAQEQQAKSLDKFASEVVPTLTASRIGFMAVATIILGLPHVALLTNWLGTIKANDRPHAVVQGIFGTYFLISSIISLVMNLVIHQTAIAIAFEFWCLLFGPAFLFALMTIAGKFAMLHNVFLADIPYNGPDNPSDWEMASRTKILQQISANKLPMTLLDGYHALQGISRQSKKPLAASDDANVVTLISQVQKLIENAESSPDTPENKNLLLKLEKLNFPWEYYVTDKTKTGTILKFNTFAIDEDIKAFLAASPIPAKVNFEKALRLMLVAAPKIANPNIRSQLKFLEDRIVKDHLTFTEEPSDAQTLRGMLNTIYLFNDCTFPPMQNQSSITYYAQFDTFAIKEIKSELLKQDRAAFESKVDALMDASPFLLLSSLAEDYKVTVTQELLDAILEALPDPFVTLKDLQDQNDAPKTKRLYEGLMQHLANLVNFSKTLPFTTDNERTNFEDFCNIVKTWNLARISPEAADLKEKLLDELIPKYDPDYVKKKALAEILADVESIIVQGNPKEIATKMIALYKFYVYQANGIQEDPFKTEFMKNFKALYDKLKYCVDAVIANRTAVPKGLDSEKVKQLLELAYSARRALDLADLPPENFIDENATASPIFTTAKADVNAAIAKLDAYKEVSDKIASYNALLYSLKTYADLSNMKRVVVTIEDAIKFKADVHEKNSEAFVAHEQMMKCIRAVVQAIQERLQGFHIEKMSTTKENLKSSVDFYSAIYPIRHFEEKDIHKGNKSATKLFDFDDLNEFQSGCHLVYSEIAKELFNLSTKADVTPKALYDAVKSSLELFNPDDCISLMMDASGDPFNKAMFDLHSAITAANKKFAQLTAAALKGSEKNAACKKIWESFGGSYERLSVHKFDETKQFLMSANMVKIQAEAKK